MGRWPRWLFVGILVYSLVAMLALIGYAVIVQPSGEALNAALDNVLALWAIVALPCAILMLALLLTRMPLRQGWIAYLIGISMIGFLAGGLLVILPLNTILTLPRSPSAWLGLLFAACFDVFAVGFILLLRRTNWHNWQTLLVLAFFVTEALTLSYQAAANAEPALAVPILYQLASGFQSISYPLGLFAVLPTMLRSAQSARAQRQTPPSS